LAAYNLAQDILEDMDDKSIVELSAAFPKLGAVVVNLQSEGLNKAVQHFVANLAQTDLELDYR